MTSITQFFMTNRSSISICQTNPAQLALGPMLLGTVTFDPAAADTCNDRITLFDAPNSDYGNCLSAEIADLGGFARFFRELHDAMNASGKEALIFIHGYEHPLSLLLKTTRMLQKAYIDDVSTNIGHLVIFSWPSGEKLVDYFDDQRRASQTGEVAFLQFIVELNKFVSEAFPNQESGSAFCAKLNLAAISMGNYLLEQFCGAFISSGRAPRILFNEVIHTAADVDLHACENGQPLSLMSSLATRVHVYFNRGDLVLFVSELVNHSSDRLGKNGPTTQTPIRPNVNYVDVTLPVCLAARNPALLFDISDELNYPTVHTYFLKVNRVIVDARSILAHTDAAGITGRTNSLRRDSQSLNA